MRILLISPTIDADKRTNKGLMMPQLSLHILAGLTPAEHQVTLIEEEVQDVDFEFECDLVGLSCMTANAPRAYELATEFRRRGKTVVMGGVHPTILPEEAAQYADSVVIGEAEGVWGLLLDDFQQGRLQPTYHDPQPDMDQYVRKDFTKIIGKRLFQLVPIMTTRGCPYKCDFCCVSDLYGTKIRHTSIENVLRDIHESKARNFMFLDDNIIGHAKYAKELFRAIKPLKINWVGQASVSLLVRDDELMQLAAESGCKGLFFGLESVSESQLGTMKKAIKDIENLENALFKIRKSGILIHASMVFGFDSDTHKVFDETVDFLIRNQVSTASFNILTPYPGTKTYLDLKKAGRLITTDWRYYDHNTVVFQPTNMSPYELQMGKINARKRFYSRVSILKRLRGNLFGAAIYLATNFAHRRQVRVEEQRIARLRPILFTQNSEFR
ncbi:MAG: B12-binding domain-containing radical SAM protein [Bacteroidetes bacterium]|nr:B12-binding domain-containing radical SAM protein [Bacteroidota bacterium]MBL0019482.1 B12-binding domain-containing radical SAM protein [Bacteroidota bacterium]MBP6639990.1 B12-binding domain-containing radical SAM protein [Bacteroidia bacterium]MBP6721738.1 B12-binding domain-containing radical SAM protein [Bacteroidia bacterium]